MSMFFPPKCAKGGRCRYRKVNIFRITRGSPPIKAGTKRACAKCGMPKRKRT